MNNIFAAIVVLITILVIFGVYKLYKKTETLVNATRQVTLYYTNWCPACKAMKPIWERVKQSTVKSGVIFHEVDTDKTPTPGVDSIPTILMIDVDGKTSQYFGQPDYQKLRNWVLSPARLY